MAAILADLLVRFGADSAELRKTLKTVEGDLKKFTRDVGGLKKALQGAFAVVGVQQLASAMARFVGQGVEAADRMGELAQQSGLAVEDLSKLSYAAELSGSNTEELATGLKNLAREMAAAQGGTKKSVELFRALGLQVTDSSGALRSTGDVLREVATKFAGWDDGPGKAAIAMELFGKSGVALIPMLNEGAGGLERMGARLEEIGGVITARSAMAADAFADKLVDLRKMGRSLSVELAANLAPSLQGLVTSFLDAASGGNAMKEVADALTAGLKIVASMGLFVAEVFNSAGKKLGAYAAAVSTAVSGEFKKAAFILAESDRDVFESSQRTMDRIKALWSTGLVGKLSNATPKQKPPALAGIDEGAKEAERALKSLRDMLADLQAEAVKMAGGDEVDVLRMRFDSGDLADELAKAAPLSAAYKEQILAAAAALATLKRQNDETKASMERFNETVAAAESVYDATRTPAEEYANEIQRLNTLLDETAIDQETYARAVARAGEQLAQASATTRELVSIGVEGFSDLVRAAREGGDAIGDVFRGLLDQFQAMAQEMLARWITLQLATWLAPPGGGFTLGGLGAGVSGPELLPMAEGGHAWGGQPYLVGEAGPELFVPGTSGQIVPNEALSSVVENYYTINALDAASFDELLDRNEASLATRVTRIAYKGRG